MKVSKLFTPGISGLAFILPYLILLIKGYKAAGCRPLDLPSNWISIHPGLRQKVVDSIFERCERITNKFAAKILEGKKSFNRLYELPIDIAVIPISIGYYFYGRFMLSKTFVATNACNLCGLCERECPVNAIKMKDGIPYWTYQCESCMHCMNSCPERAIETPHGFTAISWWLAFWLIPPLFYVFIPEQVNHKELIFDLITYTIGWIVIFAAYKLLHKLLRFKLVNRIVKYTSLTKYKFWRRYSGQKTKTT